MSGHYFHQFFLFLFFPFPPPFSPLRPFLIEGVLGSKNLFCKNLWKGPKARGRHLSRPRQPFWGQVVAILDFEGGAVVRCYGVAGGELVHRRL